MRKGRTCGALIATCPRMFDRLSPAPAVDEDARQTYVVSQQRLAQAALAVGQVHAARHALRALRVNDFERPHRAEIHLGVVRDSRSERRDVIDALIALAHLAPRHQAAARRKMSAGAMM
jgi:hypothetical protein